MEPLRYREMIMLLVKRSGGSAFKILSMCSGHSFAAAFLSAKNS